MPVLHIPDTQRNYLVPSGYYISFLHYRIPFHLQLVILQKDRMLPEAVRSHSRALSDHCKEDLYFEHKPQYHLVHPHTWQPLSGTTPAHIQSPAHVLHHFLGAAEDEYTCEAMKIFLLGAINRVFQPGCKFETMLCLVGGQGCGSPVATSKCCKHFEAPTEPTGETGEVQLFPAAGGQGRVVLRRFAEAGR